MYQTFESNADVICATTLPGDEAALAAKQRKFILHINFTQG